MKRIYLSILSVALISSINAQVKSNHLPVKKMKDFGKDVSPEKPIKNIAKGGALWSNTFGTPSDWVIANDGATTLNWQIGIVSNTGAYPTADIESTSAADGWAMLDSDALAGTTPEDCWLTNANGIDLTGFPNAVVQFENNYRRWDSRCYLVVGIGDGAGNVAWPDLAVGTDISMMNNVFDVFPAYTQNNDASSNPELVQINISSALAGQPLDDIYIRFNWTGTYGYTWFVDDVQIFEQPANDIQILSSWIAGSDNGGLEYGRTPLNHLDSDWIIGSEILNFGTDDQTNIDLAADFGTFSSNLTEASLVSGASVIMETTATPTLALGLYDGVYTAVSDNETMGAHFWNNTYLRSFEVTTNVYSQDGINVHPASELALSSLGTNSFDDGADGLALAAMYHLKTTDQVSGLRVLLANGTVAGGEIVGSIMDTSLFWQNSMAALYNTGVTMVTAQDITNGYIDLWFPSVITLNSNAYYAAVQLYSNGNQFDIRVLDDETVAQPGDASAIFIPGDQSWQNGTAFAIRMLMGSDWGVGINENTLTGVSVYPNPSEGVITVTNDKNTTNSIEVHDMLGKVVFTSTASTSTTIDLSGNGTGIYIVKVSNENGSLVERVVIK